MNDMWSYNTTTGYWTWVSGSDTAGAPASSSWSPVTPNPRSNAASWTWTSQNVLYMFGGQAYLGNTLGVENDLWTFNPSTNLWTWIGGSQVLNSTGVYGTKGTASALNQPGGRQSATTWTDSTGKFWMFGGTGIDGAGGNGQLNDLWSYSPGTGQWTWVNGNSTINAPGNYGTNGVLAATNQPSARSGATGWVDASGNLWLFGGYGINSSDTLAVLNDLWEYQTSSNQWVWINGYYTGNYAGVYGALGTSSSGNIPGSRYYASGWTDASGTFWMFGGLGYDAIATNGRLNDLWKFVP